MEKQFLIGFEHDSKRLGYDGFGQLLVTADSFEEATKKIDRFGIKMKNDHNNFEWIERFSNARNFINLTIE